MEALVNVLITRAIYYVSRFCDRAAAIFFFFCLCVRVLLGCARIVQSAVTFRARLLLRVISVTGLNRNTFEAIRYLPTPKLARRSILGDSFIRTACSRRRSVGASAELFKFFQAVKDAVYSDFAR